MSTYNGLIDPTRPTGWWYVEKFNYEIENFKDYSYMNKYKENTMQERPITLYIPVSLYEDSREFRFLNRQKYRSYKQFVTEAIREKLEREK